MRSKINPQMVAKFLPILPTIRLDVDVNEVIVVLKEMKGPFAVKTSRS